MFPDGSRARAVQLAPADVAAVTRPYRDAVIATANDGAVGAGVDGGCVGIGVAGTAVLTVGAGLAVAATVGVAAIVGDAEAVRTAVALNESVGVAVRRGATDRDAVEEASACPGSPPQAASPSTIGARRIFIRSASL
jgi:hypothetical protein